MFAVLILCLFASAFALNVPQAEQFMNVTLSSRAGTYTNPLNQQKGADPCMRYLNGRYFLTSTQNTNIGIKSATTIEGLKSAPLQVLFSDSTAGRNFDFWAPEFWSAFLFLNGNWYIYYAVAGNRDDNTHRLHVLRGGTNPNDPTAGTYSYVSSLIPANFNQWAVDGSILQLNNQLYFIFSGLKTNTPWTQCTYIVRMSNPTTLSGNAVEISCPTNSWVGGAFVVMIEYLTQVFYGRKRPLHRFKKDLAKAITVNGVTHIVYSASHCSTDDYALGLLTLRSGADPMVASSWTKAPNPVFTKNPSAGVYGPGHHFMFQKGTNWYFAYHGKSAPGQGCGDLRTTRVQPFSISGNDPVFPAAVGIGVAIAEP
uniref:Putative Arabinanase/levansucrase/invertase n=1 Tax=Moniliophthora roreri TaxID=221103 RepID=A0A0W0FWH9_MONRR